MHVILCVNIRQSVRDKIFYYLYQIKPPYEGIFTVLWNFRLKEQAYNLVQNFASTCKLHRLPRNACTCVQEV